MSGCRTDFNPVPFGHATGVVVRRIQPSARAVRTRNDDIRVCLQLRAHGMPQMVEVDANPLSTGKLERRDEIAVTSDDDECSDHVSKRQPRNVEADARPALGQAPGQGAAGGRTPARSRRRTPRSGTSRSSSDPKSTARRRGCVLVCAAPTAHRCRSGTSEIRGSRRQRESLECLVIPRYREQRIRERRRHRLLHVAQALVLLDRQHHDRGHAPSAAEQAMEASGRASPTIEPS